MLDEQNQQEPELDDEVYQPDVQPGMIPQFQPDNSNTVKLLLNTEFFLERLKHSFMHEIPKRDDKGSITWVKTNKNATPMICEEGIDDLMVAVSSFVNEITAAGIYTEDEIRMKVIWASKNTIKWLAKNCKKYSIERGNLRFVVMSVEQTVDAILKKAKNGATLETIGDMNQTREVQTNTVQQPVSSKPSFRDRLMFNPFGMTR